MKLNLLLSAALALLAVVPGAVSEEPPKALAGVIDVVSEEATTLKGWAEEFFDAAEVLVLKKDDNNDDDNKKGSNRRKRSNRRRSSRRRPKGSRRGMCGRKMRSGDRRTCAKLEREFCDSKRDRKRNDDICEWLGFGSKLDADASVEFPEDLVAEWDLIVEDVEDELYDEDEDGFDTPSSDSSFSEDEDSSEDYDSDSGDDSGDESGDEEKTPNWIRNCQRGAMQCKDPKSGDTYWTCLPVWPGTCIPASNSKDYEDEEWDYSEDEDSDYSSEDQDGRTVLRGAPVLRGAIEAASVGGLSEGKRGKKEGRSAASDGGGFAPECLRGRFSYSNTAADVASLSVGVFDGEGIVELDDILINHSDGEGGRTQTSIPFNSGTYDVRPNGRGTVYMSIGSPGGPFYDPPAEVEFVVTSTADGCEITAMEGFTSSRTGVAWRGVAQQFIAPRWSKIADS